MPFQSSALGLPFKPESTGVARAGVFSCWNFVTAVQSPRARVRPFHLASRDQDSRNQWGCIFGEDCAFQREFICELTCLRGTNLQIGGR